MKRLMTGCSSNGLGRNTLGSIKKVVLLSQLKTCFISTLTESRNLTKNLGVRILPSKELTNFYHHILTPGRQHESLPAMVGVQTFKFRAYSQWEADR